MTKQRALRLAREWSQGHVCSLRDGETAEYHSMFAAMLEESMSNEPLTIEQLREMDGEPVWVERENAWGIVEIQEGKPFIFGTNFECGYSPYWNIYRRPPEGEA